MAFNLVELPRVTDDALGSAGATFVSLTINSSGNVRVYLAAHAGHDDGTSRITAILLVGAGSPIVVCEPKLLTSGTHDVVFIARPIIVPDGSNLDARCDAISTASQLIFRSVYVELPAGQTLDGVF